MHVDRVDLERGVVTGTITDASGVNAVPIDYLSRSGIDTARWEKGSVFRKPE